MKTSTFIRNRKFHVLSVDSTIGSPSVLETRLPDTSASWWPTPMAPRNRVGETSARNIGVAAFPIPPRTPIRHLPTISISGDLLILQQTAKAVPTIRNTCNSIKMKSSLSVVMLYLSFNVDVFKCGDLQQSLDLLSSWAKSWQLNIDSSKCSVLSIHHKSKTTIPHTSH